MPNRERVWVPPSLGLTPTDCASELAVEDGTLVAHKKLTGESANAMMVSAAALGERRMDFSNLKLLEVGILHAHSQPDEVQWPEGMPPDPPVIPNPGQAPTDRPRNPHRDPNPSRERQVPDKLPPRGETSYELSDVCHGETPAREER